MKGAGASASMGMLKTGCLPLAGADHLGLIQRAYVRFAPGRTGWPAIVPITGGPAWMRSELYDIEARVDGNPSGEMMQGPMLQSLLEERFQLKIHGETRE